MSPILQQSLCALAGIFIGVVIVAAWMCWTIHRES